MRNRFITRGFLFLVSFLTITSLGLAGTGQILGVVTDSQTGKPLASVNVSLEGTHFGAATSKDGSFVISKVPAGNYTIVVSRIGYQTLKQEISLTGDETLKLPFNLIVKPVEFDAIVVKRTSLVGNKERLFNIPGSAHYLEATELAKFEYNDINRALREIPGVYIQEEDGYGLRPNISLRGTGVDRSEKLTVMEDGVLIAPAPYSAPAAYYFPTAGRMNGIEVRKGSSQIKYGPYTTGGALNLISTPIPSDFESYVELLAGEDNVRRIHATAGSTLKNFGFLAETFQEKVDGFKKLDGGGDTGFDKKDYMLKLRLNTNRDAKVYQQIEFKFGQTDEVSNETYLGLTDADFAKTPVRRYAGSQQDVMNTEHDQVQIRHFIKPADALDVTTTFYRNDFKRNWYKLDAIRATEAGDKAKISSVLADPETYSAEYAIATGQTSPNDNALMVKANNRKYYAQGIQSVLGLQLGPHEVELGTRYHEDQVDRFQWVDEFKMDGGVMKLTKAGTPGTESNRISNAKVWAGFVQLNLSFGNLTAVPGIRYENMELTRDDYGKSDPERTGANLKSRENKVDVLIPGVGLDYKLSPVLSTFLGVHKGFAPPGSKEGTEPEESINYELGARYRKSALNAQGVFFFNDYSNLLGSDLAAAGGEGSGNLFNGGEVDVKGVELAVNYDFGQMASSNYAIPLRLAYTFTDGQFKNSFKSDYKPWGTVAVGDDLPYLPRHQLFAGIEFEAPRYRISLGGKYVSKMRTKAGQGGFIDEESTDARFVIDASGEFSITQFNKLFVSIRNLTDETYIAARRPAGIRPGLPRTFVAGIKTSF